MSTAHKLFHPRASHTALGDAFSIRFTPKSDKTVDIIDHVKGGIGGNFSIEAARHYYRSKLKEGYTKVSPNSNA